jgi:CheY-like chemotaxis protein
VNNLISDTVRLLHPLLGEHIEITLQLAEKIWPVMADPAQLGASLTNLATNARDAMPHGGRLIIETHNARIDADSADAHPDLTPGDYATIEVSDTGIGMSPETIAQIFEPFFTTKEPDKGTGLGLSMVFGFLRQSGGRVSVYSELGVGTSFRLYLPRSYAGVVPEAAADIISPAARGTGECVLIVEDKPAMLRVAVRQLRDLGYRVLQAGRAAEALEVLQREPVDLLLSDIVMPGGLDGVELARLAIERWPALKIVLSSGFSDVRAKHDKAFLDSFQLLRKPYRKHDLARALREALDGPKDSAETASSVKPRAAAE